MKSTVSCIQESSAWGTERSRGGTDRGLARALQLECVLVSWGRSNKQPQTGWLKATDISSHSSGGQKLEARCHQSQAPSEGLGEDPSQPLTASGGSCHPELVTASLLPLLRLTLSLCFLPPCFRFQILLLSLIRTLSLDLGPTQFQDDLILKSLF